MLAMWLAQTGDKVVDNILPLVQAVLVREGGGKKEREEGKKRKK